MKRFPTYLPAKIENSVEFHPFDYDSKNHSDFPITVREPNKLIGFERRKKVLEVEKTSNFNNEWSLGRY